MVKTSMTWVLTNYVTAMDNNKKEQNSTEDILLKTHEGANSLVFSDKTLPKGMNGRVDVILNNPQHTVFYTDDEGKQVKGIGKDSFRCS